MTDAKKTNRKKAAGRDAYDDFLDIVDGVEQESGTKKSSAASKRKSAKTESSRSGTGASKSASKESSKTASSAKSAKKPTEKKTSGKSGASAGAASAAGKTSGSTAKAASAAKKTASGAAKKSSGSTTGKKSESASGKKTGSAAKKNGSPAAKKPSVGTPKKNGAGAKTATVPKKAAASDARRRPVDPARRGTANVGVSRRRGAVNYVDNDRDAFDEFLEQAERYTAGKKRKKGSPLLAVLLMICIVGVVAAGFWQTTQYQDFRMMKAAVQQQGFYEGTTVEGVNVSGMTLQQALDYWTRSIEPSYSKRTVTLDNGAAFTAEELGYSSDYASVLAHAYSAGRSGSLEQRYEAISVRSAQPVDYKVSRIPYRQENIVACVTAIAQKIDRPAENAAIESFNTETLTFSFRDEVVGSRLDVQKLAQDMVMALDNGGGAVEMRVEALQPTVFRDDIADQYGMITSAVTNASSSSKNRLTNIRLSLASINGVCLKPGETFSFNETVGKRTKDRGYKVATAYAGGEVTEEVGGGICQVSTTLFNAAVKAGLEIVERHNHSLTVSYVDLGKDAAVNWNSQDLRFTNNTGDNIYIYCYLSDDKRVRVGIFGKLLPDGMSITVEGKTTETIPYETVHQPSLSLAPGTVQVTQKGKNGFKAVAYKILWDANGKEIDRELLCRSTYKSITEIIEYGP